MRLRSVHLILALSLFAAGAHAEEPTPAQRVDELKRRGNQAMIDLRYADALEAYRAAIAITPDDAVLYYNLGRAEQAREAFPEALDALDEFSRRASPEVRGRVPKLDELIADVRERVAIVSVRCTEDLPRAVVIVGDRGRIEGCTTAPKQLRAGVPAKRASVEVRLESETHRADPVTVALVGGAPPANVSFTPLLKTTTGTLVVRAVPQGAIIAVDGTERGNPPIEMIVGAGAHTIEARAERHDPKKLSILVEAGAKKDVAITLDRVTPITQKWWFWTGVGVAAAAVTTVVVLVAVQPERDPSRGSISPGLVRF
jgi:hypothetical protein